MSVKEDAYAGPFERRIESVGCIYNYGLDIKRSDRDQCGYSIDSDKVTGREVTRKIRSRLTARYFGNVLLRRSVDLARQSPDISRKISGVQAKISRSQGLRN